MPCLCHCFLFNLRHLFLFIVFMIAMSPLHCFFHWPATIQWNFTTSVSLYWWNQTFYWKSRQKKKRLRLCFFHWPEVFSLRVKEKQQRSGKRSRWSIQPATCWFPKKRCFFPFRQGELQPCAQKIAIQKILVPSKNIPWTFLGAEKYQNKKKCPQRFLPPKKMAGMCFFCVQMPDGCSPLFAAAACNHLDVVKYLLCAGADKDSLLWDRPYWIKDHQIFHFWGIKQCKWMVILRAFPLVVHCLGWKYNDPFECY